MVNKVKNTSIGKKLTSFLLAILIILTMLPINAFAEDANLGKVSGASKIDVTAEMNYGHEIHWGTVGGKKYPLFCIEYGTTSPDSSYLKGKKAMASSNALEAARWIFAGYYMEHGNVISKKDMAMCQKKVWSIMGDSTSWNFSDDDYKKWCDNAKANMNKLNTYPSFDGTNIGNLTAGTSKTITDTNKVLSDYPAFTYTKNKVTVKHEADKNSLTITVDKDCTATSFSLPFGKYLKEFTGDDDELLLYYPYGSESYQKLIYSAYYDPIDVSFTADITPLGSLKLVKTSEDGIVDNIKFTVTGTNYSKTTTTNSRGEFQLDDLVPGTYKVEEAADERYIQSPPQTVKVESGKTASVSFANTLKKGNLKVQKDSEDHIVKGFTFTVTSSTGKTYPITSNTNGIATINDLPVYDSNNKKIKYTVKETSVPIRYVTPDEKTVTLDADGTETVLVNNELQKGDIEIQKDCEDNKKAGLTFEVTGSNGSKYTTSTNSNGIAMIKDVPVYDSNNEKIVYTVKETDVPVRYVTPDGQTIKLKAKETSTVYVNNILKKFCVTVVKSDIEKGIAQGDAKLSGATYGLYKGETLMASYTTDDNYSFTTDYFICDDDWTLREISASEGYLVNETVCEVGAKPELYKVEFNKVALNVVEMPIKGNIAIIKHTDDGTTKIETPESGAEFQVYLKSAGSYAKAKAYERDTIVCDEDGFASTKLMPYGVYTVHQTKGWAGREKIKDFDVFISSEGKTYKYLINNSEFCSYLKVVKLDKETNKPIAYSGAAFEIYDKDNHRISMQYTYPQVTSIHTFYTNSEGYLITPEQLPYGSYTLKEVQAPYGYVLDSTPIPFTINQENSSTDTGVTVIKVKAHDMAQKGFIEITKTGEIFSTVKENEGIYTPVYETGNLSNAVFQVYAAEDIVTLDGTIRAIQGELVDEITTGKDGVAKSKELYLGKYTIIEKTAPNGYVNANEQYDIELTYAGQNVSVTSTALSVNNDRQKVMISLAKAMEQNEIFGIGMNDEILSVQFGVFANEDIKAADGTVIPADSLITFANCDENGKITFNCDLPIGFKFYVKEIATDEHYILSDTRYEFETTYAGQDISLYDININNEDSIENNLIYGSVKGLKIDRETNATIKGAVFGLFKADETEYTENNAILTAESDENGVFTFNNIPYGSYVVKELTPADNYLPNEEYHHITVNANEQIIEITVVNDMIPEIKTMATVDGEKEICATEVFTLTDTVEYKHLIPGKEYVVKGILMDKNTGKALVIDGKEITSEVTFIPESPSGTVDVLFTFDSKFIKADTSIVVFESLYRDGKELTIHADIDDEDQTVTVKIPNIKTTAKVNGKKTVKADKDITITDTVSYENLTVGKEYTIKGILMNKATGKPFKVNGKEITAEVTFIPEKSNGKIDIEFTFDGSAIKKDTELVVFETLYRDGVEIAVHADINDEGQTVTVKAPKPKTPKTGDDRNFGFVFGLGAVALGGIISTAIILIKKRKDDED